ncbi:uncharacterized protein HKW66_Vig0171690 [Vigna angularis]|uniref:Methyltransferase n=1 Tax=Phaseolus angularis TaxID=3914 RepID=A0A8T0JR56_PHAAN|nr:uncharacterized protein HKW66_Vig0171690 [Vigna angularis]
MIVLVGVTFVMVFVFVSSDVGQRSEDGIVFRPVRPSELGARSRSRIVPPPFVPVPECRRSIAGESPECGLFEGYEKLARAKEGPSNQHLASGEASSTGEGDYDMFADEDDNSKPSTDENNTVEHCKMIVYDESSGYGSSLPCKFWEIV